VHFDGEHLSTTGVGSGVGGDEDDILVGDDGTLLDTAGNLKPIAGPDAFVDALTKVQKVTGQYGATHGINADTATPWRLFQTLYSQLGGQVLSDNGTKVVLDDAKAKQVLDYLRSLTVDKKLMPSNIDYQGAIAAFANGQSGFFFQGEWEISTFQTAKMPFSMTLFPNLYGGGKYAVQADSHTLVIPKQPAADPARLEELYERRAVLRGLTRKYADDVEGVIAWAENARTRLAALDTSDEKEGND